ncbi:MAG TPA: restriction endonuclease subunit S [Smithella sp.]|nr:restriction endonuclease subunit S [Smithella sp.]HOG91571.1 restriction endonuclease subunit S [Smithella sp.]
MKNFPLIDFEHAPFSIIDGDRGKNYPKENEFSTEDFCLFLNASNVTQHGFEFSKCQFISEQKDFVLRKGKLLRDDVILTTGTIGNVAHYNDSIPYDHVRINSGMVILRCKEDQLMPQYLYYFLRSPSFHGQVNSLRSGVAQPQLPIRDMKKIKMPLLNISMQKNIASILSAYDDLIENNRRRIQLLEQAARLLYKEWFVHLRFPGHEHTKIINGIPEGWAKKRLCELADITMGQSPKSIFYNTDGVGLPFHQGVTNFGVRFPTHEVYCTVQNRIAEAGDILFSVRAPVGRINLTLDKIVLGRGLAAIRSNCGQQNFLFYALKSYFFKEDMMGGGAIFAAITKDDLHNVVLLLPQDYLVRMFMDNVIPIDMQISTLHQVTERLTQARDLLLPRLMNGEIAV